MATQQEKSLQIKLKKTQKLKVKNKIIEHSTNDQKLVIKLAAEKRSSNWLNVLPLTKYGFNLNKREVREGPHFSIVHALRCPRESYTNIRLNEDRDTFAKFMDEICSEVEWT